MNKKKKGTNAGTIFDLKKEQEKIYTIYKDQCKNASGEELAFAVEVFETIMTDTDTSKVTAIPAPCGIGKSRFTQAFITYCTVGEIGQFRDRNCIPIVVVTDRIERLNSYMGNANSSWKEVDNETWEFGDLYSEDELKYDQHKYCSIIKQKDHLDPGKRDEQRRDVFLQLQESLYKPVVLLSTQRYFSMDAELREMLFTYYPGKKQKRNRNIVIFDEKPYFFRKETLRSKHFYDCISAIQDGIPSNSEFSADKEWLLGEMRKMVDKATTVLFEKEQQEKERNEPISDSEKIFYWHSNWGNSITSDDERLFRLVKKYRKEITNIYPDFLNVIQYIKQLMEDGAFFFTTQRNTRHNIEYNTFFSLIVDNRDKFYVDAQEPKAKFFVLDATSEVSPDYKRDYVEIVDYKAYAPQLQNTTINFFNVKTSRNQLFKSKDAERNVELLKEVVSRCSHHNNRFSITYKDLTWAFPIYKNLPCYFGNAKGSNDYLDCTEINHIGNNRLPKFDYLIKYFALLQKQYTKLKNMSEEESFECIDNLKQISNSGEFKNIALNEIMMRSILEDFEQNVFRCAIRKRGNTEPVVINVFWSEKNFGILNDLIEKRFGKDGYGATINDVGIPTEVGANTIMSRKTQSGELSHAQRIIKWMKAQPVGLIFKVGDLLQEVGLTRNQWKDAKKNNAILNQLLKDNLVDGPKGLYRIPAEL